MRASIVIRTLNEERHLDELFAMIDRQETDLEVETVLIDSGSSDRTVEIARKWHARITTIAKSEFSFGRSLNRGCDFSTGEILVFISGHCIPTDKGWLQALCQPLLDGKVQYTYGRQIGDDDSNFSERRIFAKYFPELSMVPQPGFLCNNANAAILRDVWAASRFDEELTGLEDMDLAKRLVSRGSRIGYVAESCVFHHHQESWPQIRRRFEREAIALRKIMPEVQISRFDVLRWVITSTLGDWIAAARLRVRSTRRLDMLRYRWNQYVGSFRGNREHRLLSQQAKEFFFYPGTLGKAEQDEWLKPLRRTSPHEGEQPEGEGKELQATSR